MKSKRLWIEETPRYKRMNGDFDESIFLYTQNGQIRPIFDSRKGACAFQIARDDGSVATFSVTDPKTESSTPNRCNFVLALTVD